MPLLLLGIAFFGAMFLFIRLSGRLEDPPERSGHPPQEEAPQADAGGTDDTEGLRREGNVIYLPADLDALREKDRRER